jgi:hypothetical protein
MRRAVWLPAVLGAVALGLPASTGCAPGKSLNKGQEQARIDEPEPLSGDEVPRYYPGQREPLPRYYPEGIRAEIPENLRGKLSAAEMDRYYGRERSAIYDGAKLVLHITPQEDCSAVDADTFGCESVNLFGNNATAQSIYLFAAGIDSLDGIQFGIGYSPTVTVLGWETCGLSRAASIQSDGWPASGSHLALTFKAMRDIADSFVLIGRFRVRAGSTGDFEVQMVQGHYENHAAFVMCDYRVWYFDNACHGRVRVGGSSQEPTYNPCTECP